MPGDVSKCLSCFCCVFAGGSPSQDRSSCNFSFSGIKTAVGLLVSNEKARLQEEGAGQQEQDRCVGVDVWEGGGCLVRRRGRAVSAQWSRVVGVE
jgi:hypothetical protein